ncbi:uncharacterized protein LY79DRAFT_652390 [Colletotrichum navitas]|uniref:Uncharacterized protein n=1 Tax=Colletotrichum navitas TaxID=681940 RepID=A0AAD8V1Q4_9PEZI|nr:uncharacterized protein LY79DRAFT_652390 [Colletotrichum navitas]KAK1574589.1 hypothetical protein LY79DRAFT_652390 [Colletotrichum navitas]
MSVTNPRPSRLGIRSLAKKSFRLVSKLRSRTCRARPGSVMPSIHAITTAETLSSSDSLDALRRSPRSDGGNYSASFEDFWSGISLDCDSTQPNLAMDDQLATGFFGKLPEEVREMIYQELWRAAGLGQHVIRTQAGYAHSRCLFDRPGATAADGEEPWEFNWMAPDAHGPGPLWYKREMSTWCDHWKCEESREEREIWRDIARGRTGRSVPCETWTAFLPMMLTCKRMYSECASSIYDSVAFAITDIALARNLFGARHRGPAGHRLRRVNLSFRRQADEGSSFEQWVDSWSAVLRLLDTPGLATVNLWLDSDRHWLSVTANVLRRVPEALAHKVAVSLPPDGHGDRTATAAAAAAARPCG